jgi:hypothetical protein
LREHNKLYAQGADVRTIDDKESVETFIAWATR